MSDASTIKQQLRDELKLALKARRGDAVTALRTAIAAIDNAEAVEPSSGADRSPNLSPLGSAFGAAEVPRRSVDRTEISAILRGEVDQRLDQALQYEALGRSEEAGRLRREAATLEPFLRDQSGCR